MHGEMPDSISKPSARDSVRLVNQSSIGFQSGGDDNGGVEDQKIVWKVYVQEARLKTNTVSANKRRCGNVIACML